MRRYAIPLALLLGVYLDSILFNRLNLNGIRPDALLAVIVSIGVLEGGLKGSLIGAGMGLFMDVLFGRYVGISAISYMLAGAAGGLFYQKFYADNVVVPAVVAAVSALAKEHIMMLAVKLAGGAFSYGSMLGAYVLPSALMTVALLMPTHILLKRALARQVKIERRPGRA